MFTASDGYHIVVKGMQIGPSGNPLGDVIVLDPGDLKTAKGLFAQSSFEQLSDQIFFNRERFDRKRGFLGLDSIPHSDEIKACLST